MKTLKNALPDILGVEFRDTRAYKFRDVEVLKEYSLSDMTQWKRWPGTHKNVMNWVALSNGYAVGWNESPSRGWAFPVIKFTPPV